jgi:hypothetical protein
VPIPEGLTPHSLRHTYISLRALVNGGVLAQSGTGDVSDPTLGPSGDEPENDESPVDTWLSGDSWGGTRTPDLTIMSRAL